MFFLLLQLAGCSYNVQSNRLQSSPPDGIPPAYELTETPFFPQERYQCGPAALATVLVYRDRQVLPQELVEQVYLPARQGSVPVEMEAAARRYGMLSYPLAPQMSALLEEVAGGNPVLVLQNLGFSWWPRWHYAVVVGYDLGQGEMVLRSGVTRRYRVSMGVFETTWRRGDFWARVVLPAGTLPATAEPLPYLRSALALEQSGQGTAALVSYRRATERWPEAPLGWLARGNLAYRQGLIDEAVASFSGGVATSPRQADLWNNLGYALVERGCGEEGVLAVRCALALEPQSGTYRQSLQDLRGMAPGGDRCRLPSCPVSVMTE